MIHFQDRPAAVLLNYRFSLEFLALYMLIYKV